MRGVSVRWNPGRDIVEARDWDIGPVVQALLVSIPFAPQCPLGPGWRRHKQVCLLGAKRAQRAEGVSASKSTLGF
ncbi:hypothetical protein P692DRAFT_20830048, partial [Suillus brevipes Sb2]